MPGAHLQVQSCHNRTGFVDKIGSSTLSGELMGSGVVCCSQTNLVFVHPSQMDEEEDGGGKENGIHHAVFWSAIALGAEV